MYVTRQSYWHEDGANAVEIAAELDVSGPGALVERYAGEFQEYDDPRDAAEAAIEIATQWAKDEGEDAPYPITLAMNDLVYPTTEDGFTPTEAREWAQRRYDAMPKCDRCGSLGATEWHDQYGDTALACSEFCANELLAPVDEDES